MPEVPTILQKTAYTCGPACVEMGCRAFGVRVPRVRCSTALGTTSEAMCEALTRVGLKAVSGSMDEADLRYHLARGRLVAAIVPVGRSEGHWVLLSSVHRGRVKVHDPDRGEVREPLEEFTRRWRRRGRWAVAFGPG